jgi:hypothetical protein
MERPKLTREQELEQIERWIRERGGLPTAPPEETGRTRRRWPCRSSGAAVG